MLDLVTSIVFTLTYECCGAASREHACSLIPKLKIKKLHAKHVERETGISVQEPYFQLDTFVLENNNDWVPYFADQGVPLETALGPKICNHRIRM